MQIPCGVAVGFCLLCNGVSGNEEVTADMSGTDEIIDHVLWLDVDAEHRARAVRTVAAAAQDASDCRMLLDMLGLSPRDAAGDSHQRPG